MMQIVPNLNVKSVKMHHGVEWVVAAAQSASVPGDIVANVTRHVTFARAAAARGAQLIVFPELSLTGYEPSIAREVAIHRDDPQLSPLRNLAREIDAVIVAGTPICSLDGRLQIADLAFLPDGSVSVYTKQHLHPGEDNVFAPGSGGAPIEILGESVALAICADTNHPQHAGDAATRGASLYAASVLITEKGYETDTQPLQRYAREYSMTVLMANHGSTTGGWLPAGRSAIWAAGGGTVAVAPGASEALVIARRKAGSWSGEVLLVP